jgi:Tfp pilus assembly protein PilV
MSDRSPRSARRRARGITLIETTIALVILSVGILAMFAAQITALEQTTQGRHTTDAAQIARDQLEFLQRLPWTHTAVLPSAGWKAVRLVTTTVSRQGTASVQEQDFNMDYRVTTSVLDPAIRTVDVRVQWSDDDSGAGVAQRVYTMSSLMVDPAW